MLAFSLMSLLQCALGHLFIALLLIGLQQLQTILRIVPILFTVGWAVLKLSKDPFQNRFLKFESASRVKLVSCAAKFPAS